MTTASATSPTSLKILREEAAGCRACPLWKNATQTVFGEGPQHAQVMLVGEQPGDKEDLAGKPFVGPAGQMLDRALEEAGIDRRKVYVTNAVKHFKFVPRGKIRLHQKPEYVGDQGMPAMVRTRTRLDQARACGRDGRYRRAKRVRQNHAHQQEPRPPDRSR
jgi:uracil-DNA glycosylase family protein